MSECKPHEGHELSIVYTGSWSHKITGIEGEAVHISEHIEVEAILKDEAWCDTCNTRVMLSEIAGDDWVVAYE